MCQRRLVALVDGGCEELRIYLLREILITCSRLFSFAPYEIIVRLNCIMGQLGFAFYPE